MYVCIYVSMYVYMYIIIYNIHCMYVHVCMYEKIKRETHVQKQSEPAVCMYICT